MVFQSIQQGISAIQAGNLDEGARLLRIALKDRSITGPLRALACLWLAETTTDLEAKNKYYNDALAADPNSAEVRQRVERWLATQLPPTPPAYNPYNAYNANISPGAYNPPIPPGSTPNIPISPVQPNNPFNVLGSDTPPLPQVNIFGTPPLGPTVRGGVSHIVGVTGGPNGPGTGFFVASEGLLATSRYVVGGRERLTIELEAGRQIPGRVVRAYPELDLAFIYIEQPVGDPMPVTPLPSIPDDTPLMVVSYNGQVVRGKRRSTRRALAAQWFPTDITRLPDAGGCAVLDDRHALLGMMTRNVSASSGNFYGLHISAIRRCVDLFRQEAMDGQRVYCHACGYVSKAAAAGGYYCESCGALMPQAESIRRFPNRQTAAYYQEQSRIACTHCNATVGFHNGACLRCGRTPSTRRR